MLHLWWTVIHNQGISYFCQPHSVCTTYSFPTSANRCNILIFSARRHFTALRSRVYLSMAARTSSLSAEFTNFPRSTQKKNNNIGSTYGISPYIYYKNQLNAGKYTIHWYYGTGCFSKNMSYILFVSQFSKNKQMASFGASYILHTTS